MPSGQRVSHYKDYISGLVSVSQRENHKNASLLNESYATTVTANLNHPHVNRTLNASGFRSDHGISPMIKISESDCHPSSAGQIISNEADIICELPFAKLRKPGK